MQSVCSLYSCKYETVQVQVVHVKDDTSRTPPTSNKCCPTSHHTWDSMAEGGGGGGGGVGYTNTPLDKLHHSLVFSHT